MRRKRNWRRLRFLVGLALGGVALWAVSGQGGELAGASSELSRLNPGWLLLAIVVEALSLVAFARMDQRLLRCGGVRAGTGRFTAISFAAGAIASSLPAGPLVASAFGFRQFRRLGGVRCPRRLGVVGEPRLLCSRPCPVGNRRRHHRRARGLDLRPDRRHCRRLGDHDRRRRGRLRAPRPRQGVRVGAQGIAPSYGLSPQPVGQRFVDLRRQHEPCRPQPERPVQLAQLVDRQLGARLQLSCFLLPGRRRRRALAWAASRLWGRRS